MYCSNCGKKLKNNEQICPKCGNKIIQNGENNSNNNNQKNGIKINFKTAVIWVIILTIVIVGSAYFIINYIYNNKENNETTPEFSLTSTNSAENKVSASFKNMNSDDKNFNETQQAILKYFDDYEDYLYTEPDVLSRYPQLFNQAKISLSGGIVKVLKSTDEEFEVLVFEDAFGYQFGPYATEKYVLNGSSSRLCLVKGEQLQERLLENDRVGICGRYVGTETKTIDGVSYTLPVINSIKISSDSSDNTSSKDQANLVRTVAKYIFGENIKISSPNYGYLVTLDNQSNSNFKAFNFYGDGAIFYDREANNLPSSVTKNLYISADFNHFIVTTYDVNLKYAYIDYFDKQFNKIWSREFQYNSTSEEIITPIDYNDKQLGIVVDNDLYLIDLQTGENIIEPLLVGYKTKLIMMEDGVLLIGKENKDLVVKVDYKGNFAYRINGDTNLTNINMILTQIVNGKLLLFINGENRNANSDNPDEYQIEKYMIIKNDGTIEYTTKDLSGYKG